MQGRSQFWRQHPCRGASKEHRSGQAASRGLQQATRWVSSQSSALTAQARQEIYIQRQPIGTGEPHLLHLGKERCSCARQHRNAELSRLQTSLPSLYQPFHPLLTSPFLPVLLCASHGSFPPPLWKGCDGLISTDSLLHFLDTASSPGKRRLLCFRQPDQSRQMTKLPAGP